ncbi:hypothetical protein SH2C18_45580 [Clostridium sediminicola]|uniref:hypothetical protein n=1 Tax=Clostridium sediminicola TaxID=3114879 RepID=UPI0031F23846
MELNEYSVDFSKILYSAFPTFEKYQEIKEYEGYDKAYLLIEVPSPHNKDNDLWISTHNEEITVGFDWYHTHFGYGETDEDDFKLAINFIKEIIEEKIAIAVIKKKGAWVSSCIIKDNKIPEIEEDETIEIKSWNGTYLC